MIPLDDNKREEKAYKDHLSMVVELIDDKTGEIQLSDDAEGLEVKEKKVVARKNISVYCSCH